MIMSATVSPDAFAGIAIKVQEHGVADVQSAIVEVAVVAQQNVEHDAPPPDIITFMPAGMYTP